MSDKLQEALSEQVKAVQSAVVATMNAVGTASLGSDWVSISSSSIPNADVAEILESINSDMAALPQRLSERDEVSDELRRHWPWRGRCQCGFKWDTVGEWSDHVAEAVITSSIWAGQCRFPSL